MNGVLVIEEVFGESDRRWTVPATEHVANRPIVQHALDALTAAGIRRVIVACSTRAEESVRECLAEHAADDGPELAFVARDGELDLASALELAAPLVADAPCIVHRAGGLLAEPLGSLAARLEHGRDVIVMVHHAARADRRLSATAQRLLGLAELDPDRSGLGMAGVWGFGAGALASVVAAGESSTASLPIGASDGLLDVAALTTRIGAAGGAIHVRSVQGWRVYQGRAGELLDVNRLVLDQLEADVVGRDEDGNRIDGRVCIDERASVRNSVIVGPVIIGADARISDAYIGPYTAVGCGSRIEGAEIEYSIILSGASVTHVGRRITASVVGRNARLFRDFTLPRAMRLRLGDGAEVGLC